MKVVSKSILGLSSLVLAGSLLSGCGTMSLQTNATMTQSIFLDPVAKDKRVVFLNVKNTSGQEVNLESKLVDALKGKGYMIVDDPEAATYILSTNVLYCDEKNENATTSGAILGGATGAAVSGYNAGGATGMVGFGLASAAAGGLFSKLTEDTIWQMQVDINIRQKTDQKVATTTGTTSGQASEYDTRKGGLLNLLVSGISGNKTGRMNSNQVDSTAQTYETNYIEKKTVIFAEATKMGLKLADATPILEDKIASQIAGLF